MADNILLSWILLIVLSSVTCDLPINGACKVQRLDGTCQLITSCKFALTILSINDVQTLRSMFCGFEGSVPKVCCPIIDTYGKSTTTTTTTPKPIRTTTIPYEEKIYVNEELPPVTSRPAPVDSSALPNRNVCGQVNVHDKIVGGDIADIDEFPWLARIAFYKPTTREVIFACSGSLISDRYVLTAAHCVGTYKVHGVRLGEWDTETAIDCQDGYCNSEPVDVAVDDIIVHPEYQRRNLSTPDIALLRLKRPVKFTEFIGPVCLPTTEYIKRQDYIDSTFTTSGWGKTEFGQESVLKRKVNLDSVPYSICTAALTGLPKVDQPRVICAGGKKNHDSCQGDSGGPLLRVVRENYKENWFLYGVTSYGAARCGTAGKPAIYTRVSSYMDWILEVVNKDKN